jgi:hypothetical protein
MFSSLASPQTIIKSIRNPQKNFHWHGHDPRKKWALVNWEEFSKPKSLGRLGLREKGKIKKTMGEMILWRWLKCLSQLWAILWKHKYTLHIPPTHLIGIEDQIQGFDVWNTSCKNQSLIQAHAFLNV